MDKGQKKRVKGIMGRIRQILCTKGLSAQGSRYSVAIQKISLETGMEERKESEGLLPESQPGITTYSFL